jgi:hypothetical protein
MSLALARITEHHGFTFDRPSAYRRSTPMRSAFPRRPFRANYGVTGAGGTDLSLVRVADLYGQSLPDPLRRRGESLKTMYDHSAQ